jgi:hypothetical protein
VATEHTVLVPIPVLITLRGENVLRVLTSLLIIVLMALTLYNYTQIAALRSEVDSLQVQVSALKERTSSGTRRSGRTSLMEQVQSHIDRARSLALRGNFDGARTELSKGLQTIQEAGRDASEPSRKALESAERTIRDTQTNIERLWKQLGHKPDKANGG